MKNKKLVVLVKYFKGEINPFDGAALECALQMGFKDITAVAMAPLSAVEQLKGLTRLGVKAILISDQVYAGSDTLATSFILASALEKISPDIVFCGRQSIDGDTAQVPPMVAKRIDFDIISPVIGFEEGKVFLRNGNSAFLKERTVYCFERCQNLRFPSIFSKVGEVEIWDNNFLKLPENKCGLKGSPTKVIKSYVNDYGRRFCKFIEKDEFFKILKNSNLFKKKGQEKEKSGEKLPLVYYVGNLKELASTLSEKTVELPIQGKTEQEIMEVLKKNKPNAVLFEDEGQTKILAARLAVSLNVGLCADCIAFSVSNGRLVMTRPAQGGSITADIVCQGKTALATVRTAKKECSNVVFSIGNGAIEYIEQIKNLAKEYNGEIACSRMVVDGGKLPYFAQVGLTGKRVSPNIYVAFGISGAVQHICAVTGSDVIIAINKDGNAPIFDYADYGIVADLKDIFN